MMSARKHIPSKTYTLEMARNELLALVTSEGILASGDVMFQAIFGRDSLYVALDIVKSHQDIAEKIILRLAQLQGTEYNKQNEEEPGRIHHEYRASIFNGKQIQPEQQQILEDLAEKWGGTKDKLIYYGSIDATALYVVLVATYVRIYGTSILNQQVVRKDGRESAIREHVRLAIEFIIQKTEASPLSLFEFLRTNERGIEWQVMRDGKTAYVHEDGTPGNTKKPIASLEVQGLGYDALMMGADLIQESNAALASHAREVAGHVQQQTFRHFWLPEKKFFAMAIDRDESGRPRKLTTESSVPAELLNTSLFDNLPSEERKMYVEAIIRHMYSDDFMTPVGPRMRSWKYRDVVGFVDYQGAWTSWIVTSNIFAKGLERQGYHDLARDMEQRICNAINTAGNCTEFFYVTESEVMYDPKDKHDSDHEEVVLNAAVIPQESQAWTISALYRILLKRETDTNLQTPASQSAPLSFHVSFVDEKQEIEMAQDFLTSSRLIIDLDAGQLAQQQYCESYGLLVPKTQTAAKPRTRQVNEQAE